MICFAGLGAWSKEQQQSVRGVLAREHREWAGQARGGTRGWVCARTEICGLDIAHVPAVDVLVEGLCIVEHCGRPTMRRQEHNCCV